MDSPQRWRSLLSSVGTPQIIQEVINHEGLYISFHVRFRHHLLGRARCGSGLSSQTPEIHTARRSRCHSFSANQVLRRRVSHHLEALPQSCCDACQPTSSVQERNEPGCTRVELVIFGHVGAQPGAASNNTFANSLELVSLGSLLSLGLQSPATLEERCRQTVPTIAPSIGIRGSQAPLCSGGILDARRLRILPEVHRRNRTSRKDFECSDIHNNRVPVRANRNHTTAAPAV